MGNKFWSLLFGVVLTAAAGLFVVSPFCNWWLPRDVSEHGHNIDTLFYVILAVTAIFYVLTEAILVYNMWRSANRTEADKVPYQQGNHKLELIWTLIPGVLLVGLAFVQIPAWAGVKYKSKMPSLDQAHQLDVNARQWEWRMRYAAPGQKFEKVRTFDDIHVVNELHMVKGKPTVVHLKTLDVLHSFFLPNFRIKQDAVAGKNIPVWFTATDFNTCKLGDTWVAGIDPSKHKETQQKYEELTKAGKTDEAAALKENVDTRFVWELACAEFCGARHSMMRALVYVHENQEDYDAWLKAAQLKQDPRKQTQSK